jgi:hypothetical protein
LASGRQLSDIQPISDREGRYRGGSSGDGNGDLSLDSGSNAGFLLDSGRHLSAIQPISGGDSGDGGGWLRRGGLDDDGTLPSTCVAFNGKHARQGALQSNTSFLNPKPSTLDYEHSTQTYESQTLNPKLSILNAAL